MDFEVTSRYERHLLLQEGKVALLLLVDCSAHISGFREPTWHNAEEEECEKPKSSSGTREDALRRNMKSLFTAGLSTKDVKFLTQKAGELRQNAQNGAAHARAVWVAAYQLRSIITEYPLAGVPISKLFSWTCGTSIDEAIASVDKRVLTTRGLEAAPDRWDKGYAPIDGEYELPDGGTSSSSGLSQYQLK